MIAVSLLVLWVVLSGYFTFLPLIPGLISIPLILWLYRKSQVSTGHTSVFQVNKIKFLSYIPYIIKEIYNSNIFVAKLIIKNKYNPKIIQIENDFHNDSMATIYTNSITLTPGSITLIANKNTFLIHCSDTEVADSFNDNSMKNKVKLLGDK
jgi:multicomponent Na+:H+ antiporter subunit E